MTDHKIEYRVVVMFTDIDVRRKIVNRKSFVDAAKTAAGMERAIKERKLSWYWHDAEVVIETREVSEWTPISDEW